MSKRKRSASENPITNRKRAKSSGESSGKPDIEDTENGKSESLLHQNLREGDEAQKNGVAGGKGQSIGSKDRNLRKVERRRGSRNEETLSDQAKELGDAVGNSTPKVPRLPKRQCALLIGFCGTECNGMQMFVEYAISYLSLQMITSAWHRQPNVPTIEGILFDALVKASNQSNFYCENNVIL
jgi:tRNA pseudouridine38-40 synthase